MQEVAAARRPEIGENITRLYILVTQRMNNTPNFPQTLTFKGPVSGSGPDSVMRGGVLAFKDSGGGLGVPAGLNVNTRYSANHIQYGGGSSSIDTESFGGKVIPDELFDRMFGLIEKPGDNRSNQNNKTKRAKRVVPSK